MNILLCPLSDGGYLYPALAAGRELRRRGHRVGVLGRAGAAAVVAEASQSTWYSRTSAGVPSKLVTVT
ncbi:hypothetical protein ACWC5I_46955, partial [Kitasatospora sp. NPDC001574]